MTVTLPPLVDRNEVTEKQVRHRPWWRTLIETIVWSLLAILALEGFFNLCGVGEQEFLQPDPELGCVHIPGKLVTWRLEGYSHDYLSSAGLRDTEHTLKKPPGVYRIALLGDSATEAMQVSLNETYGKVLEKLLNENPGSEHLLSAGAAVRRYEVINFGCSSYSTGQELLQYRKQVLPYDVDAVLLMYNRGDSMENVLDQAKGRNAEQRPYFYIDRRARLATDSSILRAHSDKFRAHACWDFLRSKSRIYGVINQMNLTLSLNESRYRKLRSWIARLTEPGQKNSPPSLHYPSQNGLNVTCALIAQFAAETRAHHQRFAILIYPNWMGDPKMTEQIAVLKPYCRTLGSDFLDLTPAYVNSVDLRSNFIEYHFSKMGHALAAHELMSLLNR